MVVLFQALVMLVSAILGPQLTQPRQIHSSLTLVHLAGPGLAIRGWWAHCEWIASGHLSQLGLM